MLPHMERSVIEAALLLADAHLAATDLCVVRQQEVVQKLYANHRDCSRAEKVLFNLEERLRNCRRHRDRLQVEFGIVTRPI
jgi:hypothetical protein